LRLAAEGDNQTPVQIAIGAETYAALESIGEITGEPQVDEKGGWLISVAP